MFDKKNAFYHNAILESQKSSVDFDYISLFQSRLLKTNIVSNLIKFEKMISEQLK
jgi:hypothetical protein